MSIDAYKVTASNLVRVRHRRNNWGTGFRIGDYIVTCAHCLPRLPDAMRQEAYEFLTTVKAADDDELEAKAAVLFADPCADIAVLGCPDDQMHFHQVEQYEALIRSITPLEFQTEPLACRDQIQVGVTDVDGRWWTGHAEVCGDAPADMLVTLDDPAARIRGGTSGSPVVNRRGHVIGVVKVSAENNPTCVAASVPGHLPLWLWRTTNVAHAQLVTDRRADAVGHSSRLRRNGRQHQGAWWRP